LHLVSCFSSFLFAAAFTMTQSNIETVQYTARSQLYVTLKVLFVDHQLRVLYHPIIRGKVEIRLQIKMCTCQIGLRHTLSFKSNT
jgi:hypothetical protein